MAASSDNSKTIAEAVRAQLGANVEAAAILVQRAARRNASTGGQSGLHRITGQLVNSIVYEREEFVARIGSNLKYARIHELGGPTHPTVTAKMRGWAWAMFRETGEKMYMAIARTKKSKLSVMIPARPYLRPALHQNAGKIRELLARGFKT